MASQDDDIKRLQELTAHGDKADESMYIELLRKVQTKTQMSPTEMRMFQRLSRKFKDKLNSITGHDLRMGYSDAAAYLGFSRRTLSYHMHKGRIKQEEDGAFLRSELEKYKAASGYEMPERDMQQQKEGVELRIKQLKADHQELLIKQFNDKYIELDEVHREWADRVKELSNCLMSWENSLPPLLENKTKHEIRKLIIREVQFVLNRFAREGKWTPRSDSEILALIGQNSKDL